MDDALVDSFVAITGAAEPVARQLLEIAGGDLQQATMLFFDTDMAEALARQAGASSSAAAAAATTASSSRSRSRPSRQPDPNDVVTIDDSDDDLDLDLDDDDDDGGDDGHLEGMSDVQAVSVARTAQEEEDAAMAKRLQEEMYAEPAADDQDGVRAPMGRTTEVLVEPAYGGGYGGYGDYSDPLFQQPRRRPRGPANPFNQVWDDGVGAAGGDAGAGAAAATAPTSRQARLADLFRPPYDLMEHMSWDQARSVGKSEKRWILANIQDLSDFQCQALNRDIWKDEAVRLLVQESFLFLQYSRDDPAAESYIQYYLPGGQHENPDNYPHVGIVDPRTGEQVKVWSGRPFPTAPEFHAQLAEFLDRYSLDLAKKNPVQRTKPQQVAKDVGRMTEDEMLEMALRNSLATVGGSGGSGSGSGSGVGGSGSGGGAGSSGSNSGRASRPGVLDPDELTNPPAPGGEAADGVSSPEAATAPPSPFAQIASDRPHEEPANSPATVTRIQFRHPTGRVIRRFAVGDPVVRIYEWLKAEPLEGRAGLEFELKVVPQGHDLIEDLDRTIEEAGLKQATVMIEFLEA